MAGAEGALVSEANFAVYYHRQMRLQVCTFVSTNMVLGRMDSAQAETTALLQQVLTMLQQGPVRQRSRTLSMHSQVEPAGFNGETTRVSHLPRLEVHTNEYHSQVVANTTTSIVTFSILSPDVSLSYDRIKLRLEEYRDLLAADSDMIELSTENGKTVICGKRAEEMGEYLDRAEILLRDVIQSRDISTLIVLHHLRDLAEVMDKLKLYGECSLTGNCALDLAEALVRRSLEFRQEQAETLALIARLSVYQPRARTLFIQAVSISEEAVENSPSESNKLRLLIILARASHWASDDLGVQWLGRAVQLMTEEPQPTMMHPILRSAIYNNYGYGLRRLGQYSNAIEAYHEAISIIRTLANNDLGEYNIYLARTLMSMGISTWNFGKYDDAIVAYKEALEICTTMSARDPLQYNKVMALTLLNYGLVLYMELSQFSEAAAVQKQAISLLRNLAQAGSECTKLLCDALFFYGRSCYALEQFAEAVLAYQESILLRRVLTATDPKEEIHLVRALHDVAHACIALGRHAEANTAATEALERNSGRVFEFCSCELNFQVRHVPRGAMRADFAGNGSPPLPFSLANSSPRPVEHSGAGASHTPAETSISTAALCISPTSTARQFGLGQPGVVFEAPVVTHLDLTAPSPSFLPSNQPHLQELTNPSTRTPKQTGQTVKVSVYRKRDRIIRLFRGNRSQ